MNYYLCLNKQTKVKAYLTSKRMKRILQAFCFLGCMLYFTSLYAQEKEIRGLVTSSQDGVPLTGVSIKDENSGISTQTDENGRFTIATSEGNKLVFTFLGYLRQEVVVGNQSAINVQLVSQSEDLEEVVVVGYGTVRKEDFTGSATSVTAKSMEKRPISNALAALQGAGPGVQTTVPGGEPGSSPNIRIRGIGSYSASSSPLIVVDGVEFMGGMANINVDDVESVTVLKDAATISIFGSRGANGVIMVTTKKGAQNQNKLEAKIQIGANKNGTPSYSTVSPGEYYELMWEAYKNSLHYGDDNIPLDIASQIASGKLPRNSDGTMTYGGNKYQDIVQWLGNYNAFNVANDQLVSTDGVLNPSASLRYADDLDWLKQATGTGNRNEYGLTYSGGFNKTDFYSSMNYLTEKGWGLRSQMDRFGGRINVNSQITDWLKAGVNAFGNMNKYHNAATGSSSINNPFYFSRGIAPIYPVHVHDPATGQMVLDEYGEPVFDLGNMVSQYGLSRLFNSGRHAIAETLWNRDQSSRDYYGARAYIDINFLPWLKFTTSFNPEITNVRMENYENTKVGDGAPAGRYGQDWRRTLGYTFNQTLTADYLFDDHSLNALIGHENVDYNYQSVTGRRSGEGFENFFTFGNFADISNLSSSLSEYAMESYFFRLNYDYQKKYYLSGSVRYDGDSKMPNVNRWSAFWSISGAWRLDQENFFDFDNVDLFKLRASYGRLGNNSLGDIGYYPYQPGYEIGNNNAEAPGVFLESLGSPDLRWEGQKPLDLGLDFSFYNGRISGTFDYYRRESDGLLFSVRQPYHNGGTTSGSFSVYKNVGNMVNSGIEFTLRGNIINRDDLNWNMAFNVSTLKNKITKMPEETPEIVSSPYKREVGVSMYEYYTRTFHSVDPDNGRVLYSGIEEGGYDAANEDIKIVGADTLTYDHNLAKRGYIGKSALPKAYGSLINNFSYKNFDFEFVLMYSMGGYVIDSQYSTFMSAGPSNGANLHKDLLNGWRKPGDVTDVPRMDLNQTSAFGAASDRFLTSSNYLSLSAVNFSYRLPERVANHVKLSGARIFLSAENLWFISKRKGLNTLSGFNSSPSTSGYTMPRTLNVGVNLSL